MLKFIGALVLLAGFAATAPTVAIPSRTPVPVEQKIDGIEKSPIIRSVPGSSQKSPFYVKADCEHGCGHADAEDWLKRLESDPNAGFAGAVALFTLLSLCVLSSQRNIAHAANVHFRVTERAFVKISHQTPLGDDALIWKSGAAAATYNVTYEVKNHGRTPAEVTDVYMTHKVVPPQETIPLPIDYGTAWEHDKSEAFLVANDSFKVFDEDEVAADDMLKVESGHSLIVYGYVDYIDCFGIRHRGGYGRVFDGMNARGNNLIYPEIPGLNYDRLRVPGEGSDWAKISK